MAEPGKVDGYFLGIFLGLADGRVLVDALDVAEEYLIGLVLFLVNG